MVDIIKLTIESDLRVSLEIFVFQIYNCRRHVTRTLLAGAGAPGYERQIPSGFLRTVGNVVDLCELYSDLRLLTGFINAAFTA